MLEYCATLLEPCTPWCAPGLACLAWPGLAHLPHPVMAFCARRWVGHETPTLFYLAVFGSFISYIYSAPPLKLKQSGWAGNFALGSSYISLPWWAGQVRL